MTLGCSQLLAELLTLCCLVSPCTDYLSALARTKNIRYFWLPCSCALFYRRHKRGGRVGVGHSRPVLHATRIFLTCPARPAPTHSANTTLIPEIRTFLHVKNNLYHERTGTFFEKTCCHFGFQNPDSFARWPPTHPSPFFSPAGGISNHQNSRIVYGTGRFNHLHTGVT